jgi:hypothetical protein
LRWGRGSGRRCLVIAVASLLGGVAKVEERKVIGGRSR